MAAATKDAVLTSAVDLARQFAVELAEHPSDVGEYLGAVADGERLVSHRFACAATGYQGWQWTVTVARVPRGRIATVCEAVLLPGDGAILAPEWLPWSERLRPGDIGPGDVVPFRADDPRLEPGWTPTGDDELDSVAIEELALARVRILSRDGRDAAATRWYTGSQGPTSAGALAAADACMSCGFLVPLQGALGTVFGVCANEWSPDDGRVVSLDHGCGAHSETDTEPHASDWPESSAAIDDLDIELVSLGSPANAVPAEDAAAGDVAVVEAPVDEAPVAEALADEVPVVEAPVEDVPVGEAPADEVPAVEAPVDDVPVDDVPVDEAPADEASADEASADEAPAADAPTDDESAGTSQ
ncbi:DUF3027 domain-containing protein [Cellulomonas sp. WB94]|nr:DUF3027 domain-containing protein [Cellulomonas sp. WB94]PVU83368.1 DUF3027 domain-containing protein [Cellulomonas sp. WB94]